MGANKVLLYALAVGVHEAEIILGEGVVCDYYRCSWCAMIYVNAGNSISFNGI